MPNVQNCKIVVVLKRIWNKMTKANSCHLIIRVDVMFAHCDFGLSETILFKNKMFYRPSKTF